MSIQQGRAHRKRATLSFSLVATAAIAMRISIAGAAAQLPATTDAQLKASPFPATPLPPARPIQPTPPSTGKPITLMWEPPTENTNGSALVDLQAYRIYSGTTRSNLKARITLRNPGLASYVLEPASTAERYYAISAINSKGVESELSNVADRKR